jgi:hypothetical protein
MTGRKQAIRVRHYLFFFAAFGLVLMLATACFGGSGSEGTGSSSGPDEDEGPVFVVEGADTSVLCPDATAISSGFTLSAQGVLDNSFAAQTAPDPQRREEEYESWGRVTGYFAQWSFTSPGALTPEELSRLSEEEAAAARERARQEALASPFLAATCAVDLFEDARGARQAFAAKATEARNPPTNPAAGFTLEVSERPGPNIGTESIDIVYHYPTFNMFAVSFRAGNVIGSVSVVASGGDDTVDYAEVLAVAFMERIDDVLEVAS